MYYGSDEFNNAIENTQGNALKTRLKFSDEEIIELISSMRYYGGSNDTDDLSIGNIAMAYVEVSAFTNKMLTGREFLLESGVKLSDGTYEYAPIGYFTVQTPSGDYDEVSFTAYDRMIKFEKAYSSNLTYPTDSAKVLNEICTICGVELATPITNPITITENLQGYTCREVLGYIAGIHGFFACIDRFGKLNLRWYSDTPIVKSLKTVWAFEKSQEQYEVEKVEVAKDSETSFTSGNGIITLHHSNPYATQEITDNLFIKLDGYAYMPAEIEMLDDIRLDPWDVISVTYYDGIAYLIPCMSIIHDFGATSTTIRAVGKTSTESEYRFTGPTIQYLNRMATDLLVANRVIATKVDAEYVQAHAITTDNLDAISANIKNAVIEEVEADFVRTENLEVIQAEITKAVIGDLEADFATIEQLNAVNADIKQLDAGVADINTLIFGSASGTVIQTEFSNSVIAQLGDAQIKSAMIESVSAGKITAGDIITNNVRVMSEDGKLLISDNTIQISDGNTVRVQIGKDASNDYSINIWDANGNLMFSKGGITDSAIKEAIIRNDMVSENANIHAGKLDINSLFTEINGSSNTIKATKIYLDEEGQNLEVSFKSMNTTITDINDQMIVDNLLIYPYVQTTKTTQGITYTDIGDGTVKVSGTPTASNSYVIRSRKSTDDSNQLILSAGTYTLSGCPKGGELSTYYLQCGTNDADGNWLSLGNDYGDGVTFILTKETVIQVLIVVDSRCPATNVIFKPMLEKGTVFHPYQPYTLSRNGLKEIITSQGTQLEVLNGQISSKIWQQDITTAIDDIEIGGRNYIHYGKGNVKKGLFANFDTVTDEYGELTLTSKNNYASKSLKDGFIIHTRDWEVGATIVFSYDIMYTKWDFPEGTSIREWWFGQRYTNQQTDSTDGTGSWVPVTQHNLLRVGQNGCELNKWYHVEVVKVIPAQAAAGVGTVEGIQFSNPSDTAATITLRMKNVKIEYGTKATDWTPAPEDTESQITTLNTNYSSLNQTVNSISTTVGSHTTSLNGLSTRVTSAESNITQLSAEIDLRVKKDGVIAAINLSSETALIQASKINLVGAVTITSLDSSLSNTISNASSTATEALNTANNMYPLIKGTQTATTGSWTGKAPFSSLVDGQKISYALPYNGSGNATLNLTLSDGSTTGALAVYYNANSRVTTQYSAGAVITLTYRKDVKIGSATYTGWWTTIDSNTYDRTRYSSAIKASSAITAGNIIVGNASGYHHLKTGGAFDISYPILYASSAITSGSTGTNNYLVLPFAIATTQSLALTAYKAVYIKGKLNGSIFTPVSTAPLTQSVPTSDDGYYYILLGTAYSTTSLYLLAEHPIYRYKNGAFKTTAQIASEIAAWAYNNNATYIDGGNIYASTITANAIAANAITAEKLALGDFVNYASWKDKSADTCPFTVRPSMWSIDTSVYRTSGGSYKFTSNGSTSQSLAGINIPVNVGESIYVEFYYKTDTGWTANTGSSKLRFGNKSNTLLTAWYVSSTEKTGWTKVSGTYTVTSTATPYIAVTFMMLGTTANTSIWIDDIVIKKRMTGELIVDGSITADKIDVTDLFAQDILATGSITGAALIGPSIEGGIIRLTDNDDIDSPYFKVTSTTNGVKYTSIISSQIQMYNGEDTDKSVVLSPDKLIFGQYVYPSMNTSDGIELVHDASLSSEWHGYHNLLMMHNYNGVGGILLATPAESTAARIGINSTTFTQSSITAYSDYTITAPSVTVNSTLTANSVQTTAGADLDEINSNLVKAKQFSYEVSVDKEYQYGSLDGNYFVYIDTTSMLPSGTVVGGLITTCRQISDSHRVGNATFTTLSCTQIIVNTTISATYYVSGTIFYI